MNYYREGQLEKFHNEKFFFIEIDEINEVFEITLNRTAKKNAIHPQMLNELAFALQYAQNNKRVRVLVLRAKGDVFCSGSDLSAMQGNVDHHESSIGEPMKEVLLVNLWTGFSKPSLAIVEGNVFAMTAEERAARDIRTLPGSLGEALAIAEDSSLLRETLGDQTFSSFIKNKKIEWDQYRSTVTDYEITRYLSVL